MAFKTFESETGATVMVHEAVAQMFPLFVNPVTEDQLRELRDAERQYKEGHIPATCVKAAVMAGDDRQTECQ